MRQQSTNIQICSKCRKEHFSQTSTNICFTCSSLALIENSFSAVMAGTGLSQTKQQVDKNKCFTCNRNLRLLGIECKCGFVFCTTHRLPESHSCSIDFRLLGRVELKRQMKLNEQKALEYENIQCDKCDSWIRKNLIAGHVNSHASLVMERLLLGDKVCSKSKEELIIKYRVTHIVNAAEGLKNYFEDKGVKYINLKLKDNHEQQLIVEALMGADFIDSAMKEGGVVFVHCAKGKSRSVSVIILYLMMHLQMSYQDGYQIVRNARSIAKPNSSYQRQLKKFYQNVLKPK